jgi:hypothetical protein
MLRDVQRFKVSRRVRAATENALKAAGRDGYEVFVLWTGDVDGETFKARNAYLPEQQSFRQDTELLVHIGADALFQLNLWLYERRQVLGAQIHSHPHEAYHSLTDDEYPIVTALGGLSLVVPDFGAKGLLGSGVVGYRLEERGWVRLPIDFIGHVVEFAR